MSLLQIDSLSLDIHGAPVLRDVSLAIAAGEILAITGESGSGKSMTALAVMQLLPQGARVRGAINLATHRLTEMTEPALCRLRGQDIGMVFQEPMTALNPVQTIGAQVAETLLQHGGLRLSEARAEAQRTLHRVGLPPERFAPTLYPHQLSGGQRQRMVIAMAIARKPKLLIADEPTTALDVTTQAQILSLLVKLTRADGMGMMLITHDLAVVAQHADRIAVMRQGEVVEQGQTGAVISERKHPYTRMLFEAATHRVDLPKTELGAPLITAVDLRRRYRKARTRLWQRPDHFDALRGVSFTIAQGERLGLVGESGCGKSTLTRVLLGLDPLQQGSVRMRGDEISSGSAPDRAARRHMQVVFQDPFGSFNPRHKVHRLITEPYHLLDRAPSGDKRVQAVADALTAVGLRPADADRYIHEFSGGQRQRIAIARALMIRPDLIIFDEAVSALDVSVRAQILDLLAELCRSHALTYLFISHDLSVVRRVTDRVLVMQDGTIVEEGPTEEVFTKPQHLYTKKLVAAVPRLDVPAAKGSHDPE